ncbi:putative magnesium chelatase accessory protein [Thioflavicoccus mobilis 8321]|uniref:Putative magnesium chelatase accessory protein n=1 Tax=Thioflavicoccus mobilis 8321 TaxID=765912 RepID=L0GVC3_9GAMM|nr:alpha/beta fold hydrolase BchO [Thioflavicoccus mobilis]AGA89931.1 putative magnesium chelatase accessory protein [Thioflavicoccus mobilis 8321]
MPTTAQYATIGPRLTHSLRPRWPLVMALLAGLAWLAPASAGPTTEGAALARPDWAIEGRDWPNRNASHFVEAGGIRWHYQRLGEGPVLLLLHGTGAATHSWQALLSPLAEHFTVIAPDLPGHGFTETPPEEQFSLEGMAQLVEALLEALDVSPDLVVGHSAGAAILARMTIDGQIAPRALISLNGAFLGRGGVAFHLFAPIIRIIVTTDWAARLFAWRASDPKILTETLASTGSTLTPEQLDWYARLFSTPAHTGAALKMMAKWHLETLERDLPRLEVPVVLVVGSEDGFVAPQEAYQVQALLPQARVVELPGLGHLAHEERPDLVVALILEVARTQGLIAPLGAP